MYFVLWGFYHVSGPWAFVSYKKIDELILLQCYLHQKYMSTRKMFNHLSIPVYEVLLHYID